MSRSLFALALVLFVGCTPEFDYDVSRVDGPRVLAVRAVPPEVGPNGQTTLIALYVDESGTLTEGPLDFTLCTARKPLAELGPVARACLDPASSSQVRFGQGVLAATATVPANACSLFGPSPPPPKPNEPAGRPVDPDLTSGFYQPALVFDQENGEPSLAPIRINCGLGAVSQPVALEWNRRSRRNANPIIDSLTIVREEGEVVVPIDGTGTPPMLTQGETITLRVSYADCPLAGEDVCGDAICGNDETLADCPADCTAPVLGCGGAESYIAYDSDFGAIVARRESMRVAWYGTRGDFAEARTGRASEALEPYSDNTLFAPTESGELVIWVVLRDDRGGTAFRGYRFTVP